MRVYFLDFTAVRKKARYVAIICFALVVGIIINQLALLSGFTVDVFAQEDTDKRIVIIDAGHGGEDPGAIGVTGVLEKDLNLEIAALLTECLEEEGICVINTRTSDKLLYNEAENIKGLKKIYDLKNRCKIANAYKDAVFISVHMNSFSSEKYNGLQVYYSDSDEESYNLALKIQNTVKQQLQNDNNRNPKNGKGLYILDNNECTSVLIECGFISNESDCKNLSKKEYQKQLCFSIVCGIIEYMNSKRAFE